MLNKDLSTAQIHANVDRFILHARLMGFQLDKSLTSKEDVICLEAALREGFVF